MTYYRLEYPSGIGVFTQQKGYIDCKALGELRRKLPVPKVFMQENIPPTKSWFTEYGYKKYKSQIEEILDCANNYHHRGLQLIVTENPGEILMRGKLQIVTKL